MPTQLDLDRVDRDESIDRFVRLKKDVRSNGTVKRDAFRPPSNWRFSVERTHGCTHDDLWTIYARFVEPTRPGADGTARLIAAIAYDQGLGIEPDSGHFGRHANLTGWPIDTENKPLRLSIQQALADASQFVRR